MTIFESIKNFISSGNHLKENAVPEGVCPACWGHQEYGNQVREIVADHQVDVNAGRENYNFIKKFVVEHVEGIHLKNGLKGHECPRCHKVGD